MNTDQALRSSVCLAITAPLQDYSPNSVARRSERSKTDDIATHNRLRARSLTPSPVTRGRHALRILSRGVIGGSRIFFMVLASIRYIIQNISVLLTVA